MQKRVVLILNILILMIILVFVGVLLLNAYTTEEDAEGEECVDVNRVSSFVYEMCYDAYTRTIFVGLERGYDSYDLRSMKFSFFDVDNRVFEIEDVPGAGESKAYKIEADRNPDEISIRLDIVKDFSAPICSAPRVLPVKYCPVRETDNDLDAQISPFIDYPIEAFVTIEGSDYIDSDVFSTTLFEKEVAWESKCSSDWECSDWGACSDGLQRRECIDNNDCSVPIGRPQTVKYCDNICVEDWQCIWSECSGGVTTPSCQDLNDCGTKFNQPKALPCDSDKSCTPDVQCSEWSSCEVDYNFLDLVGGDISRLNATRSRVCSDNNRCSLPKKEVQDCGVNLDIYAREFTKCGKDYIGIYNQLDDTLIARVDIGTESDPILNLYLDDDADSQYCDYCFNGRMDGDESGIDCGGGCMSCEDKYGPVEYTRVPWFSRIFGF